MLVDLEFPFTEFSSEWGPWDVCPLGEHVTKFKHRMYYSSEGQITDYIGLVAVTMVCAGGKELKSSQALDLGDWQPFTETCSGGFTKAGAKLFPTSSNVYSVTVS